MPRERIPLAKGRFNGAPDLSPGRAGGIGLVRRYGVALQWSPRPESGESIVGLKNLQQRKASFNGAPDLSPGRELAESADARAITDASMEPQT